MIRHFFVSKLAIKQGAYKDSQASSSSNSQLKKKKYCRKLIGFDKFVERCHIERVTLDAHKIAQSLTDSFMVR